MVPWGLQHLTRLVSLHLCLQLQPWSFVHDFSAVAEHLAECEMAACAGLQGMQQLQHLMLGGVYSSEHVLAAVCGQLRGLKRVTLSDPECSEEAVECLKLLVAPGGCVVDIVVQKAEAVPS